MDVIWPIRRAETTDRAPLLALWTALVEHHRELDVQYPATPGLRRALDRELTRGLRELSCRIWVALHQERIVGFLFAEAEGAVAGADGGGMAWIHELYVIPEFRKSGAGHQLVAVALSFFADHAAARISVRVESGNAGAMAFWRSQGFDERAVVFERDR